MRICVLLALTLLGTSAHARGGPGLQILGWTKDATQLLWQPSTEPAGAPGDMGESSASIDVGVARDARTGIDQRHLLATHGSLGPDKKRVEAWPKKAAWDALVAKSAAACASQAQAGPEGATLEVEVKGAHVKGKWAKDEWKFYFDGDEMAEEKKATFVFKVKRGDKAIEAATATVSSPMAGAGAGLHGSVRVCWAAQKRIALVVRREPGMMRDTGDTYVVTGPTTGPRIQLVADKAILEPAAQKVGAALEAGGFVPTASKASNEATPRPATVIYAAAGFEADAARAAAAIPGGATVAKLDWKVPFDLVVGIGASAMK